MLGAGSTAGTFEGLSGVEGFVGRLERVRGSAWRREYPHLARAVEDCDVPAGKSPGLDRIWTRIDYYSKLGRALRAGDYPASLELHRAVLDAYGLTRELAALPTAADFTLKTLLRELEPGDVLISFNWDTAAEHVARALGLDLAAAGCAGAEVRIRLIKPHGSLSWPHCADATGSDECTVVWEDGSAPRFDPMKPEEVSGSPGHFREPLVLGAVPIKSELLAEVQSGHPKVYETISDQWAEAVRAITQATELVVAGYGFPPEDGYGHFLLREAARRRGRAPLPIAYYSLPDGRSRIEASIRDIFGTAANYAYRGVVERVGLLASP